jgi:hypothetical protein
MNSEETLIWDEIYILKKTVGELDKKIENILIGMKELTFKEK